MDSVVFLALLYRRGAAGVRADALRRFFPDLYNTLCHRSGVFYPRPACIYPNLREMPFRLWYPAVFPLAYLLPLPALGGIYALLFFCHFYFAIKKAGTYRSIAAMLYVLALVLFTVCDITVAWGYFTQPAPETVWLFYAPSQLLLALTARAWRLPQRFFRQRKGKKALPSHRAEP